VEKYIWGVTNGVGANIY